MSESGSWSVRRPDAHGRRVPRTLRSLEGRPFGEPLRDAEGPAPAADAVPTILVAGIVYHLERFQELGYIQRARWSVVVPGAVRGPADLVVVGAPSGGGGTAALVAELKKDAATAAIPVLHLFPADAPCDGCGADVCLALDAPPATLVGAARSLLDLRRTRQELRREREAASSPRDPPRVASAPVVVSASPPDQEALHRAQRLEVLGRLTGGVAHDINNLLGVITGQVEFAIQRLLPGDLVGGRLAQVLPVVERAAGLTRQLLSFAREPVGRPRPVDINTLVGQLERILERAVGDEVKLEVRPGPGLGSVRADPTQLEQVLLNLAFNARDAMPTGGRLTVETHNVDLSDGDVRPVTIQPGRYVMLSVSDEGMGMDERTLARIFEPFFTTKTDGRGTGLGLATVQGIVKQSGGSIRVDSERGLGTTFRIYFPRIDAPGEAPRADAHAPDVPGGTETVLVAEDSEPVREVTCGLLEALGYRVLAAAHGVEALGLARDHAGPIHLLLSDVVMPKLGGPSLAEQFAELRPETRVLYMSGYGEDAFVGGRGRTEPALLRKPFSQERLARAVRQALGGPPGGEL
jgi:two-component system cell cycle sensor histidine kinase/response regulator CckA